MTARQGVLRFFLRQVAVRTGWPVGLGEGPTTLGEIVVTHQQIQGHIEPSVTFPLQPEITAQALCHLDTNADDASSWLHSADTNQMLADIDLPSLTWRLLKREDESDEHHLDKFGRFDQDATDMASMALDHAPVLDIAIEQFIRSISKWTETAGRPMAPRRGLWPDGKKAAVCLTHDVDRISGNDHLLCGHLYWWAKAAQSVLKGRFAQAVDWIKFSRSWLGRRDDPMFSFSDWMKVEGEAGVRSTFFFLALDRALSKEGRRYAADDPRLKEVTQELIEGGWEVGVHFARRHHLDPGYLASQRAKLSAVARRDIQSARQHFLNVSYPETWQVYAQAGICVSSNVGYHHGRNGFRAGTCWPYFPEVSEELPELIEIPYQIIDRKKMREPHSQEPVFKQYAEHAKRVGGVLVVDYHQEHFSEELWPHVQTSYRAILKAIADDPDLFCTTLEQVAEACRSARLPTECTVADPPNLRTQKADTT